MMRKTEQPKFIQIQFSGLLHNPLRLVLQVSNVKFSLRLVLTILKISCIKTFFFFWENKRLLIPWLTASWLEKILRQSCVFMNLAVNLVIGYEFAAVV